MQFDVIWQNLPLYAGGLLTTAKLLSASLLIGLALSLPLAITRVTSKFGGPVVWLYTYILRGTPMLVQLYLIYYGLAQFEAVRQSWAWDYLSSATFCACLAFALNTSAYTTEILVGAIKATNHGEIEAAKSVGMSRVTMFRRILLPSALRRSLPAYSNEVIMMLHGTSLASIVTLIDITGAARKVYAQYYLPFEAFIAAGAIYLTLTFVVVKLFKKAEGRWLAHLQPRKA